MVNTTSAALVDAGQAQSSAIGAISRVMARPGRITGTDSAGLPPKPRAASAAATVSSTAASTLVPSTSPGDGFSNSSTGPSQIAPSCWNGANRAANRAGPRETRAISVGRVATITAPVAGSTSHRPRRPLGRMAVQPRCPVSPRRPEGRAPVAAARVFQYRSGATVRPGA
jgi:hypothetical protein